MRKRMLIAIAALTMAVSAVVVSGVAAPAPVRQHSSECWFRIHGTPPVGAPSGVCL